MAIGAAFFRRAMSTCAALLAVVGLMLATCVIPAAARAGLADPAPSALWTLAGVAGGAAALLAGAALLVRARSFLVTGLLGLTTIATLLVALFLNDAGMAYWGDGPALRGAALASFTGAGTCLIVATTVLSTAFLLPGRSGAGGRGARR